MRLSSVLFSCDEELSNTLSLPFSIIFFRHSTKKTYLVKGKKKKKRIERDKRKKKKKRIREIEIDLLRPTMTTEKAATPLGIQVGLFCLGGLGAETVAREDR